MSWTLKLQRENHLKLTKFTILEDDIFFYAILKRGQVEHFKKSVDDNYQTRVRVIHLGEFQDEPNQHIVFYMTLLESSTIEHFYPKFISEGIMGRWKLSNPNSEFQNFNANEVVQEPIVSLIEAIDEKNIKDFIVCAQSKKNPEFIRNSYLKLLYW